MKWFKMFANDALSVPAQPRPCLALTDSQSHAHSSACRLSTLTALSAWGCVVQGPTGAAGGIAGASWDMNIRPAVKGQVRRRRALGVLCCTLYYGGPTVYCILQSAYCTFLHHHPPHNRRPSWLALPPASRAGQWGCVTDLKGGIPAPVCVWGGGVCACVRVCVCVITCYIRSVHRCHRPRGCTLGGRFLISAETSI
jgi:hypothetical protein